MLPLPYNTDAPIYYWPFATVGLIFINTVVLMAEFQADPRDVSQWILQFGNGIHPVQWITSAFMHEGPVHLIGNMFFLWGFGLVVEGKLGWWKFLLVYLGIAACTGFAEQVVMLNSEHGGGALGASGVLFGLMIISAIWAPKNEMSCVMWIFRLQMVEIPMTAFAATYLVWQAIMAALTGFSMSSAMLHLDGAIFGAIFGVALLKLHWVECEGWDLFAVWRGREGRWAKPKDTPKLPLPEEVKPMLSAERADFLSMAVKNRFASGDAVGTAKFYCDQRREHPQWQLSETELMSLVKALHQRQLWSESIPVMVDYLRLYPDSVQSARVRLKLAQILIDVERRSTKALKVLAKHNPANLPDDLKAIYAKLVAKAQKLQEDSEIEVVDGDDW